MDIEKPPQLNSQGMSRRGFLTFVASTGATAALAMSGCSLQPTKEATAASAPEGGPARVDFPTSEDFPKEYLTFDEYQRSLAPIAPIPNGRQLVFAQIGDSKVNASLGFPPADLGSGTQALMGLSRWHKGLDPRFHSDNRPCTTDTSVYDNRDGYKPDVWMPKAFSKIMGLPINGIIVNTPRGIYAYQGGKAQKDEWYKMASGVLSNMKEMVRLAYQKAEGGTPMALTFLHPVQIPIPGTPEWPKDFDLVRVNENMLKLMQEQITGVVPETPLLRLSVNSKWWDFIKNRVKEEGGDVNRLSTLFGPDDKDFNSYMHPIPENGKFYYGDLLVEEYENMDRFVREQSGLPISSR